MSHQLWHAPVRTRSGRFANMPGEKEKSVLFPSISMYLATLLTDRHKGTTDFLRWNDAPRPVPLESIAPRIRVTWIGHASFLLEYRSFRILLDPVFHDLTFLFPRISAPGLMLHKLPVIDAVLISHNHRDHLEQTTTQWLNAQDGTEFLIPAGDGRWMRRWNIARWQEYTWWESRTWKFDDGSFLTATFVPAHHWSQRNFFDRNRSLWGGWMISTAESTCFFAGDTAYSSHFHHIAERFPQIDLALLPIGPCEPARWMRMSHINAEEAGRAFLDLRAQRCIPMHWGTFGFGTDQPLTPLTRFEQWWHSSTTAVTHDQLCTLRIGQSIE